MEKNEIILYGILFIVVAGLVFSVVTMVKSKGVENTPENYNKFVSAQNPNDICKTPEGYTDEEWREHMGHHPDQYKGCL